MLTKEDYFYTIAVPLHKELGIGLLKKILQQAQISRAGFNHVSTKSHDFETTYKTNTFALNSNADGNFKSRQQASKNWCVL